MNTQTTSGRPVSHKAGAALKEAGIAPRAGAWVQ